MKIHEIRQQKLNLMILVGNIGLGKTTFAKSLVDAGYVTASADAISSSLVSGITGTLHGAQYAKACAVLYEHTVYECLRLGISVIADDLNLTAKGRSYLCQIAKSFDANIICVDFGAGTLEGLRRRSEASDTFDYQGFDIMFQDLKSKYEKPTMEEGFSVIINKEAING